MHRCHRVIRCLVEIRRCVVKLLARGKELIQLSGVRLLSRGREIFIAIAVYNGLASAGNKSSVSR